MSITLNTKVYSGIGFNQNGQSVLKETSGGYPSAFSYLTDKVNGGTGKNDSTVKWNLSIPVVSTAVDGAVAPGTVLRTYFARIEVQVPASSTAAERDDLYARLLDLVESAQFTASIKQLAQAND